MLVTVSAAGADDIKLPDMGSPADAVLSKSDEAQIGRQIMAQLRAALRHRQMTAVRNLLFSLSTIRISTRSRYQADTLEFTPACWTLHATKMNSPASSPTRLRMSRNGISLVPFMPVNARASSRRR
jgi:hypothetical protein